MRKHLPTIAMVVGALLVAVPLTFALSRMWHFYAAGASTEAMKREAAWVTWLCMVVVPFGLLAITGGWLWRRNDAEVEQEIAERRELLQKKRQGRPDKFAR